MTLAELLAPDAPATVTVEQAAQLLGVSRGVAYLAARQGQLPVLRLGHRLLVPVPRLVALIGAEAS